MVAFRILQAVAAAVAASSPSMIALLQGGTQHHGKSTAETTVRRVETMFAGAASNPNGTIDDDKTFFHAFERTAALMNVTNVVTYDTQNQDSAGQLLQHSLLTNWKQQAFEDTTTTCYNDDEIDVAAHSDSTSSAALSFFPSLYRDTCAAAAAVAAMPGNDPFYMVAPVSH